MVGTLFNAITIAAGAGLGLILGHRLSDSLKAMVFQALGLFTLGISIPMILDTATPFAVFLSMVFGGILGHLLKFQSWIDSHHTNATGENGNPVVTAVMLFCAGAMTLVGCMEDGLKGDATILFIKGSMDFVSAAFLAATMGRRVLLAAPLVLMLQGILTGVFAHFGSAWSSELIGNLTGYGGILLIALGLELLNIRRFSLINFIPGFLLIPLFQPVAAWIETVVPTLFTLG